MFVQDCVMQGGQRMGYRWDMQMFDLGLVVLDAMMTDDDTRRVGRLTRNHTLRMMQGESASTSVLAGK